MTSASSDFTYMRLGTYPNGADPYLEALCWLASPITGSPKEIGLRIAKELVKGGDWATPVETDIDILTIQPHVAAMRWSNEYKSLACPSGQPILVKVRLRR